jgi:hypothetical protein
MKKLLSITGFLILASWSHVSLSSVGSPSSQKDILLSVDLGNKELRVLEGGQIIGEFKIHMKDPYKNPQCRSSPEAGKYPVINKELIYKSQQYGVIGHYAIAYRAPGGLFLIKEDDGTKSVAGGHCDVMLGNAQGSKLFALIEHAEPKHIVVEIFN